VRKRIVASNPNLKVQDRPGERWIDLAQIATVEVTSEESSFPIESVLHPVTVLAGGLPKKADSKPA
jgi:hypothetical protein